VSFKLHTPARRIAFAFIISLLLHGLILWGPDVQLPRFKSSLPPLTAKLEALPTAAPARLKTKRKARPALPKPAPEPTPQAESAPQEVPLAASEVVAASAPVEASAPVAASAPVETGVLASETDKAVERPPLPMRAQLTFDINKGTGEFRVGEAVHTLEIDDGRYVLHAVMRTVGVVKLFKSFELTQYSSGSYSKYGLHPEQFFEERKESSGTLRNTAEFDHAAQLARFSNGKEVPLPPDTQDILSIMYQFPPLQGAKVAAVSVSNGKKIERYEFEIVADEEIVTALGTLLTVRLSKLHGPNEEGLEIWLAREYRLFPVKMRFFEKNGDVTAEAVITDIRVSEEEGVRKDAAN
jgi:hypothetical protein